MTCVLCAIIGIFLGNADRFTSFKFKYGQIHFQGWMMMGKTYYFRIKINGSFFLLISNMMFEIREKTMGLRVKF